MYLEMRNERWNDPNPKKSKWYSNEMIQRGVALSDYNTFSQKECVFDIHKTGEIWIAPSISIGIKNDFLKHFFSNVIN